MKKLFTLLSLLIIGLSSCQKIEVAAEASTQASIDDAKIQAYIKANNITATKDASGLYYQIITPGTAPYPTSIATVKVSFSSSYINGVAITKVEGATAKIGSYIAGMRTGLYKIGTGGRILLIIPSGLAFGSTPQNDIPANSVVVYTVDLIGF